MQVFFDYINRFISLSSEAQETLQQLIVTQTIDKGEQLLSEGQTCKRLYFIESGTLRTFHYQDGKDITYWIHDKNTLVTSWNSYLTQQPASEYIEAISKVKIHSLSFEQWQKLYLQFPELERFGRLVLEEQMALIDGFYRGYYFLTAKEKYELLLQAFPKVTQIANLGHIASMLGISQETLSRIRK